MARRHLILVGTRFGRWTVLRFWGKVRGRDHGWLCRCDCGKEKRVVGYSLLNGGSRSCGCSTLESTTTHGMSKSSEWKAWMAIKARCLNPKDARYPDYGGRGIKICNFWKHSFENFFESMGPKPFPKATIERIDNDGPYAPWNCKWVSQKEQLRNTRRTIIIEYDGICLCLKDWAVRVGVPYSTLRKRRKLGWDVKRMLSTPSDIKFSTNHDR